MHSSSVGPRLRVLAALSFVIGCAAEEESSPIADASTDATALPARPNDPDELDAGFAPPPMDSSLGEQDAADLDATAEDVRSVDAGEACVPDGGEPRLATPIVEHACLHGSDGPFRVVTGASTKELAPDVSRPHTLFTVMGQAGATSYVRYTPGATGDHALFVARAEVLSVEQGAASLLLERSAADCRVLPVQYITQLPTTDPVDIALRADAAAAALVLESLAPWGTEAWARACGSVAPSVDAGTDAGMCRKSGPCSSDSECCSYCHDYDHCH